MWKSFLLLGIFAVCAGLGAAPKEKIAVSADNRAKLSEDEIQTLTGRIEAKLNGKYNVVTRSALEAILRENQFQTESGLVDNRATLARFGKISGVNLLLHCAIGKLGNTYTASFQLVNCSTGEVAPEGKAVVDAGSFPQLVARLDIALGKMGLLAGEQKSVTPRLAVLPVKVTGKNIPAADAAAFGTKLAGSLRKSGAFELLERADLDKIVRESKMVDFALADSGQYAKIAQLSVADELLVLNLRRLENNRIASATQIAGTSSRIVSSVQADFKILEVKTGKVTASGDFKFTMRSTEIPASEKRDWTRCLPGVCQKRSTCPSRDEKSDRPGGKNGRRHPGDRRPAGAEHSVDCQRESGGFHGRRVLPQAGGNAGSGASARLSDGTVGKGLS